MEKIKVLMVLGNTGRGGAQTFAMNVLRNIDRDRFQVDFVVNEMRTNGYESEIMSMGSMIHVVPFYRVYNHFSYVNAWEKMLCKYHYDIVHGHVSSSASVYLNIAKKHGCKTIAHSHSAGYRGKGLQVFIKKLFTLGAKDKADYWFACSELAAIRMFGKDYKRFEHYYDMPNAILTERYRYDSNTRSSIRSKHAIPDDAKLFGHVGSFTAPKNHEFLFDVFSVISREDPSAKLILAGDGELADKIKEMIIKKDLSTKVILLGNVGNVNEYLMAMDALIFPSIFEGFPVTVIEAEAAGLYCVISDSITKEVYVTHCVKGMSLDCGSAAWARMAQNIPEIDRIEANDIVSRTQYNMHNCIELIMRIYQEMCDD